MESISSTADAHNSMARVGSSSEFHTCVVKNGTTVASLGRPSSRDTPPAANAATANAQPPVASRSASASSGVNARPRAVKSERISADENKSSSACTACTPSDAIPSSRNDAGMGARLSTRNRYRFGILRMK